MVGIVKRKKINRSKCMEIHELGDKLILKYQIKQDFLQRREEDSLEYKWCQMNGFKESVEVNI